MWLQTCKRVLIKTCTPAMTDGHRTKICYEHHVEQCGFQPLFSCCFVNWLKGGMRLGLSGVRSQYVMCVCVCVCVVPKGRVSCDGLPLMRDGGNAC